jgi:hypothetical protein
MRSALSATNQLFHYGWSEDEPRTHMYIVLR